MDHLLRPGIRLLRRFAVAGKFFAIAAVLVVPLSILTGGMVLNASGELQINKRERWGVTLARPLTLLVTDLFQRRIATLTGQDPADLTVSVHAVDAAEATIGPKLGLHDDWLRLREQVLSLKVASRSRPPLTSAMTASAASTPDPDSASIAAVRHALALLDRVGNTSALILDQRLDTYYLAMAILDRLPNLLDAATAMAENLPIGRPPGREATALSQQLGAPLSRLTNDLNTAVTATRWAALDNQLRLPSASLRYALADFSVVVCSGPSSVTVLAAPGRRLMTAVATMLTTLSDALSQLLSDEGARLVQESVAALAIALSAVFIAAYLFAALAHITSRDAREVLADINTLSSGALHQSRPLVGSDEFAQMSKALVLARDQLTALLGTLRYQATHDELTALANRALFSEKLTEALSSAECSPGVVVIDLDGVRDVNDSFGHDIGDRLLRLLGARFHRAAHRQDLVARLGADQFGLLIADASDSQYTSEAIAAIKAVFEQPVDVDGRLLRVQASVGTAISPDGGTRATELLRNADVAMHAAKSNGAGALVVFEPSMHEVTRERTELSFDLVQAVEQRQLTVVYQPIVDLTSQTLHGVEALVRWYHPTRGLVSPSVFVPLAETTGFIVPIGRWVMRQAVEQLARWRMEFPNEPLTMDINLAADQLGEPDLVDEVLSLIREYGVDPASIVLEITESALVRDLDTALRRLSQLAAVGVRLALDDFGTGYSSLSYLRRLPVTVLKIDKSFVTASDASLAPSEALLRSSEVLLKGIVSLGTGLGMEIIAEGIETPDQARQLRAAGCHLGQGFLWSRPVSAPEVGAILRSASRPVSVPRPRGRGRHLVPTPGPEI